MAELFQYSSTGAKPKPPVPLVSILTGTTGRQSLVDTVQSVIKQSHDRIQHLVFVDGTESHVKTTLLLDPLLNPNLDVVYLPYAVGKDRWNAHRMYAAGTYLAEGQFIMFLDDDNTLEPDHIASLLEVINKGNDWAFSFRNIMEEGKIICQDNCESLGKWHSCINQADQFVDVNCYLLRRDVAVAMSPVWFRKFREPGQPEVDRVMFHVLSQRISPKFDTSYKYTLNYAVGTSPLSVQKDFFIKGNEAMLKLYNGVLPWQKILTQS
ncbi:MAG: glycosyltransferase [Candidatus Dormibacteria bacterium]